MVYISGRNCSIAFQLDGKLFSSWFKGIEEKEEILPNAGYSSKKDISGWVDGSSLDTARISKDSSEKYTAQNEDITEELSNEEQTELLTEEDKT